MTIQISRKCEYALKAMVHIAGLRDKNLSTARNISGTENIPLKFLEKILQALVSHDLLKVSYGPKGGYRLAKKPADITFRDIIEAVDGPLRLNLCVGDEPECLGPHCAMKSHWERLQLELERLFEKTTLAVALKSPAKVR